MANTRKAKHPEKGHKSRPSKKVFSFSQWEQQFDADGAKDYYRIMEVFCRSIGDYGEGNVEPMVVGTKQMLRFLACWDGIEEFWIPGTAKFMRMQTYDPMKAKRAKYVIGVQSHAFGWARLISDDATFDGRDLADFHQDYRLSSLVYFKPDGSRFSAKDHQAIINFIESDLHFDFGVDVQIAYECSRTKLRVEIFNVTEDTEYCDPNPAISKGMKVGALFQDRSVEGIVHSVGSKGIRLKLPRREKLVTVTIDNVYSVIERTSH